MNCNVSSCDRATRTPGSQLCEAHYYQQRRGKPFTVVRTTRKHKPVEKCSVDGCHIEASSHYRPMCPKHEIRVARHGDPHILKFHTAFGADNPNWSGSDVGYTGAHDRVRQALGTASSHTCVECERPALHWAYDHSCPDEKTSEVGPFSVDLDRYHPMCVPCHKKFDLARLA